LGGGGTRKKAANFSSGFEIAKALAFDVSVSVFFTIWLRTWRKGA
jgi:hypothetical protein